MGWKGHVLYRTLIGPKMDILMGRNDHSFWDVGQFWKGNFQNEKAFQSGLWLMNSVPYLSKWDVIGQYGRWLDNFHPDISKWMVMALTHWTVDGSIFWHSNNKLAFWRNEKTISLKKISYWHFTLFLAKRLFSILLLVY